MGNSVAYRMIAERENERVNCERESRLLIAAKARVFSSEGWKVVVTDGEGKLYEVDEFEKLLPAWGVPAPEAPLPELADAPMDEAVDAPLPEMVDAAA